MANMLDMSRPVPGGPVIGLREIASRLNISVSTVSRALAGDPGVKEVKAAAIRAAAEQMGYRPRPVRRKRAGAVGLIISTRELASPDDDERYTQNIVWWMERFASQLDLHVHVHFVRRDDPRWPSLLLENRIDGVVLAGFPSLVLCQAIRNHGIPAVSISDTVERTGLNAVAVNPRLAVIEAVDRLVGLGHRDIALVSTNLAYPVVGASYDGFRTAFQKHGLPLAPDRLLTGYRSNMLGGREAASDLMRNGASPTAIIFANDWMALGGLMELQKRGRSVPEDISIVGHDNLSICREIAPQLSTIDRKVDQVIVSALEILKEQIAGDRTEPAQRFIPAELVWRESCATVSRS